MAKDTLAVYESHADYVERFIHYAHGMNNFDVEVWGFTDLDILKNHLRKNRIDAVLFSQDEVNNQEEVKECLLEILDRKDVVILVLGEQPAAYEWISGLLDEGLEKIEFIEKYQSVEKILAEIKGYLKTYHMKPLPAVKKQQIRLAGIYSPVEKVSHPDLAVKLVRKLKSEPGMEGARILYVNMEPFSGIQSFMDTKGEWDISDILYCYKTNPSRLAEAIQKAKGSYMGMEVLQICSSNLLCDELDFESWPDFLKAIFETAGLQYMIFDLSEFNLLMCEIISGYGNLYIPALPNRVQGGERSMLNLKSQNQARTLRRGEEKMKEFQQFLEDKNRQDILDKILELEVENDLS